MVTAPDFQPLYKQVYSVLVRRIAEGAWRPAQALPSEQALAAELGVSQGTVRKALDALAAEHLVVRRQGKGTYVAEQTQERSLFRFFRLSRPSGERVTPESAVESVGVRPAKGPERTRLDLAKGDGVVEIRRTRAIDDVPSIVETIIVPHSLFAGLEQRDLPNTLYSLYQSDYAVSIAAAEEQLKAVTATKAEASRLGLEPGAPLLRIDRVAIALDGKRVEWRISRCDTRKLVYAVTVR